MTQERVRRLGRGLEALLGPTAPPARLDHRIPTAPDERLRDGFTRIATSAIVPNPLQPRKVFNESELAELRASIETNGLLQPILVRPRGAGYELVAGERRFRAVQALGWTDVPAQVRDLNDQDVLTLALIENLQRSDLDPIEEAEGYQELISRFALTQQQVADAVGRERPTVANTLRLLALPDAVRSMVRSGELSLGHARTLLGLADVAQMIALARAVVSEGLTVREVERRVRTAAPAGKSRQRAKKGERPVAAPGEVRHIEEQLRRRFQTDVGVSVTGSGRGQVHLSFYSADDLERLLDLLLGPGREVA